MYRETNESHDLMFLEQDFGQSWDEAWMMWDETNLPKMNTGNARLILTSVSVVCFIGEGLLTSPYDDLKKMRFIHPGLTSFK